MNKLNKKNEICVAGWHFPKRFYKRLKESKLRVHVVAHRYNKILDELNFNYTITKNVGLELEMFDYYIKKVWDKKSNILFIHDDSAVSNKDVFHSIISKCEKFDCGWVFGKGENFSKRKSSDRCIYFSSKLVNLFLKKYGGIWYDINDKGYTLSGLKKGARKEYYNEDIYVHDYFYGGGSLLKASVLNLIDKYKLKSKKMACKNLVSYKRGSPIKRKEYFLNDNSIFGREANNPLEDIMKNTKIDRRRENNYYTKWYNFYFSPIRYDNLNILEMGLSGKESLEVWGKYFKNSDIYGLTKNLHDVNNKIFIGDRTNEIFLEEMCSNVSTGFDIIIDDGNCDINTQFNSFKFLFSKLNAGGIYVLENLQEIYKKKLRPELNIINFLKERIDDINCKGRFKNNNFEKIHKNKMDYYEKRIASVHFYTGICFIFKRFCQ